MGTEFVVALVVSIAAITVISQSDDATTAVAAPARSIDFVSTYEPIKEVLISLGRQTGVNIVVETPVQGRVTVSLRGASFDQALTAIIAPLGHAHQSPTQEWHRSSNDRLRASANFSLGSHD